MKITVTFDRHEVAGRLVLYCENQIWNVGESDITLREAVEDFGADIPGIGGDWDKADLSCFSAISTLTQQVRDAVQATCETDFYHGPFGLPGKLRREIDQHVAKVMQALYGTRTAAKKKAPKKKATRRPR